MAVRPFSNEPSVDFTKETNALPMRAAIAKVRGELGREYDLVIGGKHAQTSEKIKSLNPARPSEIVGVHQKAGIEHVEPAMQAALTAFESWKNVPVDERAGLLLRTAEIIRKRKPEFNAWMVLEVGKNWDEAEADTCEAIDFLEFYARLALHMAQAEPAVQLPGERDQLRYIALGVGAVIPPWNFPLAIMCGMTAASIVCGNTVVLKPSSDSPTIAAKFFEALEEAGLPPGVVNFCPGSGATFGNGLVEHPKTRFIAFTGSRDVGLDINVRAAQPRPGSCGSSARFSRWAARIPSSSRRRPIWTQPSKVWRLRHSASRGKNARHVPGSLWIQRCTTSSSRSSKPAWRRFASAIRRRTLPRARLLMQER
jgi:1-pyrroline-5-carboxylate dehydrogenase